MHNLPLWHTCPQRTPVNTIYLHLVMSLSDAITWHKGYEHFGNIHRYLPVGLLRDSGITLLMKTFDQMIGSNDNRKKSIVSSATCPNTI